MLKKRLTKILVMVLSLALLMTAIPPSAVLAEGGAGAPNYNFDSKFVAGTINVDGVINEPGWNANLELTQGKKATTNNVGKFGTLWDTQNLYVGFDVTDACIATSGALTWKGDAGPWDDDSVEIYIDGNNSKTYDNHAVQYIFRWNDSTIYKYNNAAATTDGIKYAAKAKADGSGYIMEIAIPWKCLNDLSVEEGDTIGITTHINDRDDDGLGNENSVTKDTIWYAPNVDADDYQDAANWASMKLSSVIFSDDCSDLSTWHGVPGNNTADSIYVTDNANPVSPTPSAITGEFKFYANYANTKHNAVDIYKAITLTDTENWTINVNMKIDSLQKVGAGLEDYDGFVIKMLPSTTGRYFYMLFSEGGVKVRNSSTPTAPISTIGDGNYHDYSFSWNPTSCELAFAIDGVPITTFKNFNSNKSSGGLFMMTMTNYNRKTANSGVASVYVNSASISRQIPANPNILVNSTCDSIASEGWKVVGGSLNTILNDTEKAGNFYLFSDSKYRDNSTKVIEKTINLSNTEKWSLDVNMQINELRSVHDSYKGYYGLNMNVANGEKLFKILMTQEGVSVNQSNDVPTAVIPFPSGIIGDGKYHKYGFAWDGTKNLEFAIDGIKLGSFTGISIENSEKLFSIKSENYMVGDGTAPNQPSGKQEAYIDSISLTKNTTPQWALYNSKIKYINILPESDALDIKAAIIMEEISEEMINNNSYEVKVKVFAKDNANTPVATTSSAIKGEKFVISIPNVSPDTLYTIKAQLEKSGVVMNSYERECRFDSKVEVIGKDSVLSGKQDLTYLYTDVKGMAEKTNNWLAGTYSIDGITNYDYVENKSYAGTLNLPLTGVGKYAVYIGYLNGTEQFNVSNSKAVSNIDIIPEKSRTPHSEMKLYGTRSMSEVFSTVVDFSAGEEFSIIPKEGAYARIAYIRLKPMTETDTILWERESDGINRLVYNNDGYSDFYMGYYTDKKGTPDIKNFLDSAINRYAGKNVAALDWTLGTTLVLNQASQYCSTELFENINKVMTGKSEEITDLIKREDAKKIWVRLRSGDELAIKALLGYIKSNNTPLKLLEERGDQLGINVNVSIRMEAFYDPLGDNRWLNGTDYSKFTRVKAANGNKNSEISLADTKFQDYLINILKESITQYGADGVNLDFVRYPYVLGYELADYGYDISTLDKLYAAKREVATKFMRRVRNELPEGTAISARIPINELGDQFGNGRGYKENGLDFEAWTLEGLIDILIPCDISYEEFHSLTPFVNAVNSAQKAGKKVTLYCGITNDLGGHDLTKDEEDLINQGIKVDTGSVSVSLQQYRLRALEAFNAGAECIYVFNDWKGANSLGYIGDKVALEKWYGLAYEVEAVQNLATVNTSSVVGGTIEPPIVVEPPISNGSGDGNTTGNTTGNKNEKTDNTVIELGKIAVQDDILKELGVTKAEEVKFSAQVVAKEDGFTIKIIAEAKGKSVEVKKLSSYLTIEVPVKENIAIGMVLKDGRVIPVPTKLEKDKGVVKAVIHILAPGEFKYMTPVAIKDSGTSWASGYINELSLKCIISGDKNGYFYPGNPINRAEFATILQNALGLYDMESTKSFGDVDTSAWYAGAVNAAEKFGLMSGYKNGKFGPQNYLTREEAMVVLASATKLLGLSVTVDNNVLQRFTDADSVSGWAKEAAILAVSAGLIAGDGGKLNPSDKITKEQVIKIIGELLKKTNLI